MMDVRRIFVASVLGQRIYGGRIPMSMRHAMDAMGESFLEETTHEASSDEVPYFHGIRKANRGALKLMSAPYDCVQGHNAGKKIQKCADEKLDRTTTICLMAKEESDSLQGCKEKCNDNIECFGIDYDGVFCSTYSVGPVEIRKATDMIQFNKNWEPKDTKRRGVTYCRLDMSIARTGNKSPSSLDLERIDGFCSAESKASSGAMTTCCHYCENSRPRTLRDYRTELMGKVADKVGGISQVSQANADAVVIRQCQWMAQDWSIFQQKQQATGGPGASLSQSQTLFPLWDGRCETPNALELVGAYAEFKDCQHGVQLSLGEMCRPSCRLPYTAKGSVKAFVCTARWKSSNLNDITFAYEGGHIECQLQTGCGAASMAKFNENSTYHGYETLKDAEDVEEGGYVDVKCAEGYESVFRPEKYRGQTVGTIKCTTGMLALDQLSVSTHYEGCTKCGAGGCKNQIEGLSISMLQEREHEASIDSKQVSNAFVKGPQWVSGEYRYPFVGDSQGPSSFVEISSHSKRAKKLLKRSKDTDDEDGSISLADSNADSEEEGDSCDPAETKAFKYGLKDAMCPVKCYIANSIAPELYGGKNMRCTEAEKLWIVTGNTLLNSLEPEICEYMSGSPKPDWRGFLLQKRSETLVDGILADAKRKLVLMGNSGLPR